MIIQRLFLRVLASFVFSVVFASFLFVSYSDCNEGANGHGDGIEKSSSRQSIGCCGVTGGQVGPSFVGPSRLLSDFRIALDNCSSASFQYCGPTTTFRDEQRRLSIKLSILPLRFCCSYLWMIPLAVSNLFLSFRSTIFMSILIKLKKIFFFFFSQCLRVVLETRWVLVDWYVVKEFIDGLMMPLFTKLRGLLGVYRILSNSLGGMTAPRWEFLHSVLSTSNLLSKCSFGGRLSKDDMPLGFLAI